MSDCIRKRWLQKEIYVFQLSTVDDVLLFVSLLIQIRTLESHPVFTTMYVFTYAA